MRRAVKICGVRTHADVEAAAQAGARYVGLVFFDRSPRNVSLDQARALAVAAPVGLCKVALVVDPSDEALDNILERVPVDMIQLHGHEPAGRVAQLRQRAGLPVIKAVGIGSAADLPRAAAYADVADLLLLEAKAPAGAARPGGNGQAMDWSLLSGHRWAVPWMLAGGLTPQNVAQAIGQSGAMQLDVSSGVESAPGVKDAARIAAFVEACDV